MTINFRTELKAPVFPFKIDHTKEMMMLGSCFSDNIGSRLVRLKFAALPNPFGVLYNPASIANNLSMLAKKPEGQYTDIFEYNDLWHAFDFHGSFSGSDKSEVLQHINSTIKTTAKRLGAIDFLFITFGTAWVFEKCTDAKIVANCHKLPANHFRRRRLDVHEIVDDWTQVLGQLKELNDDLQVIFTVSPIRHLKDGLHENQISKATLQLAADTLVERFDNCHYFPSYEIVLDDLRDYRFYAKDLTHLSDEAIDYLFEKFADSFFSKETVAICKEIDKIMKAKEHQPMKRDREMINFAEKMTERIKLLELKYPYINFMLEKRHFKNLYLHN